MQSSVPKGKTCLDVPPKVSVLMPVFNPGCHLAGALSSIQHQTFTDFELVVIDDGSSDGSDKLLQLFAANEPRVRLTIRHNLGLIATRNQLLENARGEFVAWMDADDVSLPDRLARQVEGFSTDPSLVCLGTAAQCIDPDGNHLNVERYQSSHDAILAEQEIGTGMRFPTTMMRRDVAMKAGGFREPFKIGEDLDLLIRIGEIGRLGNLGEILYLYRQSISSVCATIGPYWLVYRDQVLELARQRRSGKPDLLQAGHTLTIPPAPRFSARGRAHAAYTRWAQLALANSDWPLAWKYLRAAITARPLAKDGWKVAARTGLSLMSALLGKS